MAEFRNVRISENTWVRLKHRAADERVTLRELVERAVHVYLAVDVDAALKALKIGLGDTDAVVTDLCKTVNGAKELVYDREDAS